MCPMKHFYPKRGQSDACPALSGASVSVVLVAAVHCGNGGLLLCVVQLAGIIR